MTPLLSSCRVVRRDSRQFREYQLFTRELIDLSEMLKCSSYCSMLWAYIGYLYHTFLRQLTLRDVLWLFSSESSRATAYNARNLLPSTSFNLESGQKKYMNISSCVIFVSCSNYSRRTVCNVVNDFVTLVVHIRYASISEKWAFDFDLFDFCAHSACGLIEKKLKVTCLYNIVDKTLNHGPRLLGEGGG